MTKHKGYTRRMLVEAPPVEFLTLTERIYQTVCAKPGLRPSEIAEYLEVKPNTVRAQLTKLKKRGLVENSEFGTWYEKGSFIPTGGGLPQGKQELSIGGEIVAVEVVGSAVILPRPAPTTYSEMPVVSSGTRYLMAYIFCTVILGFFSYWVGLYLGIEGVKRVLGS